MNNTILKNRPKGFRATGVVIKDNKLLIMEQIVNGEKFYTLPGGTWEFGETLEETCIREVFEEFSINVSVVRLIFLLDTTSRLNFVFECDYIDGEIELGGPEKEKMNENEQYYVHWIELGEISSLKIFPEVVKKP